MTVTIVNLLYKINKDIPVNVQIQKKTDWQQLGLSYTFHKARKLPLVSGLDEAASLYSGAGAPTVKESEVLILFFQSIINFSGATIWPQLRHC